ncbi:hypothetical protein IE81DRAFT_170887 [Ceraceosorus guamensis]|uniref:Uncharacterized protein n=1 Tax=Ceraceosorus guamensis TaxID=1522189 RepID=A0A316VVR2_9BASI|nr:hypothetical protein IE81DRAFT_170887 [Ceraceosorus guamensis]PWN41532.1 hypothetical protein IE81DRAFT_170887 [Ceraceosorus guamensis]
MTLVSVATPFRATAGAVAARDVMGYLVLIHDWFRPPASGCSLGRGWLFSCRRGKMRRCLTLELTSPVVASTHNKKLRVAEFGFPLRRHCKLVRCLSAVPQL